MLFISYEIKRIVCKNEKENGKRLLLGKAALIILQSIIME